jgi:asparagine synthase (glutamine-hydrolysing)
VLRHHFAELLPQLVLERTSKAIFNAAFFGEATRDFAAGWDGTGLSPAVDAEWLRANWLSASPHAGTQMLLQAAWLAAGSRAASATVAAARSGT